jgi:DNA-directed RNA polymerase specialized sigma24 family protein
VFTEFTRALEPKLLRAFTSRYGVERGREATAEALAWGWEHWERVNRMENPAGYLYRVGASRTRGMARPPLALPEVETEQWPWVEPGLPQALARLSNNQRTAVLLVHSFGWTYAETAELMEIGISTVQKHIERALAKLRDSLEVTVDA